VTIFLVGGHGTVGGFCSRCNEIEWPIAVRLGKKQKENLILKKVLIFLIEW